MMKSKLISALFAITLWIRVAITTVETMLSNQANAKKVPTETILEDVVCQALNRLESPEPQFYAKHFMREATLEFWQPSPVFHGQIVAISFVGDTAVFRRKSDGEDIEIPLIKIRKVTVHDVPKE